MKDKEHGVCTEYSQDISKLINKNVHCMLCSSTSTPHKEQKDLEDSNQMASKNWLTAKMKICINLCSIQTEFKKLLNVVISEVNHHRCLPFNPTQILALKSNAAPIMSVIWSLARLLWLVYDHKVSIICANVPILSTAADYC